MEELGIINVNEVMASEPTQVAVVRAIMEAKDPKKITEELLKKLAVK